MAGTRQHLSEIPSLAVLRCFEVAAKHQSFTAAAEELGLTQGAVSRHVRELEGHIGAALFRREGRGVRLTEAGKALSGNLFADLGRLRRTIAHAVAAGEARQVLRIATLPTFGARWLVPRLPGFKSRREDIELVLSTRNGPFDLQESGVDVAIHFGSADWPGAQLTPLCPEGLVAVASPELLKSHGADRPEDIFGLPLLHIDSRPYLWEHFRLSLKLDGDSARRGSYFDQFSLIISAAVAGLGAAILPRYLIENELAAGELIQVAQLPPVTGQAYFIATPSGMRNPLAAQFIVWIRKQVGQRGRQSQAD